MADVLFIKYFLFIEEPTFLSCGILALCFAIASACENPPSESTNPLEAASWPLQTRPCATVSIWSIWWRKELSTCSKKYELPSIGEQFLHSLSVTWLLYLETMRKHFAPTSQKVLPRLVCGNISHSLNTKLSI